MNPKNPEDAEKINPFPEDESYQDGESKIEKIPVQIYGSNHFHLIAKAGKNISAGISCGGDWGSLEEGIERVIRGCKQNARAYLNLLKERFIKQKKDRNLAEIIANYRNIDELFILVYPKANKEKIEGQLGKYSSLEKKII